MHDYSLRFANLALGYEGLPAIQNITGTIQKGPLQPSSALTVLVSQHCLKVSQGFWLR